MATNDAQSPAAPTSSQGLLRPISILGSSPTRKASFASRVALFLTAGIFLTACEDGQIPVFPTPSPTKSVVTVAPCSLNGWVDQRNPNTQANFTSGVAAPILGQGVFQYSTLDGSLGNFRNESFHNLRLASLTAFHYSSYIQSRTNNTDNLYVVLQVDRTGDGLEDDRLIFEPRWQTGQWVAGVLPDQGPTLERTWQRWDMLNAIYWLGPPQTLNPEKGGTYFTLPSYLARYPDARIVNQQLGGGFGGIRFNVGTPRVSPFTEYWGGGFTGYMDAFTIGVNGHNTIYDFEATCR
jgi:hypothetical protein